VLNLPSHVTFYFPIVTYAINQEQWQPWGVETHNILKPTSPVEHFVYRMETGESLFITNQQNRPDLRQYLEAIVYKRTVTYATYTLVNLAGLTGQSHSNNAIERIIADLKKAHQRYKAKLAKQAKLENSPVKEQASYEKYMTQRYTPMLAYFNSRDTAFQESVKQHMRDNLW
jgi:hypothetical protein